MKFHPTKLYYKIGEVCEILEVEPHVLRYWETEFSRLTPPKNQAGQRTYRPKDIELLLDIRKLLYEDGFTIAGARKQLAESRSGHKSSSGRSNSVRDGTGSKAGEPKAARIRQIRGELENILTLLDRQ